MIFGAQVVAVILVIFGCVIVYDLFKEKQTDRQVKKLNLTPPGGYPPWIVGAANGDTEALMRRLIYDVHLTMSAVHVDLQSVKADIQRLLEAKS